jgi:hypothetical protein
MQQQAQARHALQMKMQQKLLETLITQLNKPMPPPPKIPIVIAPRQPDVVSRSDSPKITVINNGHPASPPPHLAPAPAVSSSHSAAAEVEKAKIIQQLLHLLAESKRQPATAKVEIRHVHVPAPAPPVLPAAFTGVPTPGAVKEHLNEVIRALNKNTKKKKSPEVQKLTRLINKLKKHSGKTDITSLKAIAHLTQQLKSIQQQSEDPVVQAVTKQVIADSKAVSTFIKTQVKKRKLQNQLKKLDGTINSLQQELTNASEERAQEIKETLSTLKDEALSLSQKEHQIKIPIVSTGSDKSSGTEAPANKKEPQPSDTPSPSSGDGSVAAPSESESGSDGGSGSGVSNGISSGQLGRRHRRYNF